MITRYIAIVFFFFYCLFGCSAPQRPETQAIIKNGDALIAKADKLERDYKKNPASVSVSDVKATYEGLKESWLAAKDALIQAQKYGDYQEKRNESNQIYVSIGKTIVYSFRGLIILAILYGLLRLYLTLSPTGILSKFK